MKNILIAALIALILLAACKQTTNNAVNEAFDACALLKPDEGKKLCGFEKQISGEKEYSCVQTFQQATVPYGKVIIRHWDFANETAAVEKLKSDRFMANGKDVEGRINWFEAEDSTKHATQFVKGKRMVKITDIPKGSCVDFKGIVSLAYERA